MKTKPSSAKHHASILNTMLSFIFEIVQVSASAQRLTAHVISNHLINNPRYWSTWDINQLHEYWRERPESKFLSNEELQVKLASVLMSLYFVRMEEMENIDLLVSIIDDEKHTAAVCISPKQSKKRERYDVRRTEDPKSISNRDQQISYTYSGLKIWSKLIRDTLAHAYKDLHKHLDSKGRLRTPLDTHLLQNEQHRVLMGGQQMIPYSSALVKNHGKKQATQIFSKQRGGARVSEGDGLQQSPQGDDLQLSPQEALASTFSFRIISTQPFIEAESHNDHESAKVYKSQMQKDDQDVEPQEEAEDSSMTKDSDRPTNVEAYK
ncbi:MAG: hypothetical protein EZS28_006930 [Streblomastix strix]|uniref:Tyr recombinase domain-containing protein n=1 Tax=Streblomastix strix TaxID=222440 RepID=A0A5J4WRJ7_9EUKA|nr:MAG: hypothetical protein EZS28_006930 [Streblomastix strix]